MSSYSLCTSAREIHIMAAGEAKGRRTTLMIAAKVAGPHLRETYVKHARDANRTLVRARLAVRDGI